MEDMMQFDLIFECFLDALVDCLKLIPFLFFTYLAMEALEHKAGTGLLNKIKNAGKIGPLWGALAGVIPQCGFSAAASSLYAGRVITLGTLFAVFLSTSDEMLPIFLSESVPLAIILKIICTKLCIALISGFIIEFIYINIMKNREKDMDIHTICEHEHCSCKDGILLSASKHTFKITGYLFLVSFVLNILVETIGADRISGLFHKIPVFSILLSGIVGLIPNCAASVAITQMYLEGIISSGAMMAGLLVGAGVGLLVLLKLNRNRKENAAIVCVLYMTGIIWGLLIDFMGISFL